MNKQKAAEYFEKSYFTAKYRYETYHNTNKGFMDNISFIACGNLKKSCRKRYNTCIDTETRLYSDMKMRDLFLQMFELPLIRDNKVNVSGLKNLLYNCQRFKHYTDEYCYHSPFSDSLSELMKPFPVFIIRYGKIRDQKYLLPKFTI